MSGRRVAATSGTRYNLNVVRDLEIYKGGVYMYLDVFALSCPDDKTIVKLKKNKTKKNTHTKKPQKKTKTKTTKNARFCRAKSTRHTKEVAKCHSLMVGKTIYSMCSFGRLRSDLIVGPVCNSLPRCAR